ncbi:MAG: hypothetical protein IJ706_00515 [Clostridia bacterium]|nr:hypothetical protein [Clostridia bacterium]MBR1675783.1 hypothetical protein [Clostridia bacterium]
MKSEKMTFKGKKLILTGFLAVMLSISAIVFAAYSFKVAASPKNGWDDAVLKDEYLYGETLDLKDRNYVYEGKTYSVTPVTTLPDGTKTSAKNLALTAAGEYSVSYSGMADDGTFFHDEASFLVNYPVYSYLSQDSSATIGRGALAGKTRHAEGLYVSLAQGDTLTFSHIIDMTKVTKFDTLVSCYVDPTKNGMEDFQNLIFTFTDIEDPSVYIKVKYHSYIWTATDGGWSYASAAGNGQVFTGLHTTGIKVNNGFGPTSQASFIAQKNGNNVDADETLMTVRFDMDTNIVYTMGTSPNTFCIDLDNGEYFSNLWTGFKSGKVRLSINATDYIATSAKFCVLSVFGLAEEGEMAEVCENPLYDTDPPEITVDAEEEMPSAVVGRYYSVPTASAYDLYSGNAETRVSVYYNYNTASAVSVPVKEGKFFADKEGVYAIVYEAKDIIGNVGKEIRWVNSAAAVTPISFDFPDGRTRFASVGQYIYLSNANNVVGGSGEKTVTTSITSPSGERQEVIGGFRVLEPGEYEVTYTATDYVGQTLDKSYTVTVSSEDSVVIAEDPAFYPIYISGAKYKLPEIYAYTYKGGELTKSLCSVKVSYGGRKLTYTSGNEFVPTVNNNGDKITFEVLSGSTSFGQYYADVILPYEINPVYGDEELKESNYFYGTGFNKTQTANGLIISAVENSFEWTYANPVDAFMSSVTIAEVSNVSDNAKMTITLTDALNQYVSVSATLANYGDEGTYIEVGKARAMLGIPFGDSGDMTTVSFDGKAFRYASYVFPVWADDLGRPFGGFTSDKLFLKVRLENKKNGAAYTVRSIGDYNFKDSFADFAIPMISIHSDNLAGRKSLGEHYVIPAASSYDVFAPMVDFYVSVTKDGKAIKDVNGVKLEKVDPTKEYEIVLSEYGRYSVTYYSIGYGFKGATRANDFTAYAINVYDSEGPKVSVENVSLKAKAGTSFKIPKIIATDNISKNVTVLVFVRTPTSRLIMVSGESYALSAVGTYEFMVMAMDEVGNSTIKRFAVTAE